MTLYKVWLTGLILVFWNVSLAGIGKVEINITGLKSSKGQVMIKAYTSEDGFPRDDEKAIKIVSFEIKDNNCLATIELPEGEYALAVHHDENKNDKVDTNFIGIPKEPLGLSNYEKVGRPDYDKAKFVLEANESLKLIIPVNKIF